MVLIQQPLDLARGTIRLGEVHFFKRPAMSERLYLTASRMVEAGGIEPPSEGLPPNMTTCLAAVLISLIEPPAAGSLRAIRFGSRPHPLRQENRPIPLNDILAGPVGEDR